jgi:hypothetical protein
MPKLCGMKRRQMALPGSLIPAHICSNKFKTSNSFFPIQGKINFVFLPLQILVGQSNSGGSL